MSKSKYKVVKGAPAFVVITGEPVYVKELTATSPHGDPEEGAKVVRAVVTSEGIVYRHEYFPLEELETRFEQAKRHVEFEEFAEGLRRDAENRMYSLSPNQLKAVKAAQAKNPSTLIIEGTDA